MLNKRKICVASVDFRILRKFRKFFEYLENRGVGVGGGGSGRLGSGGLGLGKLGSWKLGSGGS